MGKPSPGSKSVIALALFTAEPLRRTVQRFVIECLSDIEVDRRRRYERLGCGRDNEARHERLVIRLGRPDHPDDPTPPGAVCAARQRFPLQHDPWALGPF